MKTYAIEEQDAIGKRIATIFKLKRDKEHKDRYQTEWGSKTAVGIFNTFLRLAEDIKAGNDLNA
jgi:hypothetical protein